MMVKRVLAQHKVDFEKKIHIWAAKRTVELRPAVKLAQNFAVPLL